MKKQGLAELVNLMMVSEDWEITMDGQGNSTMVFSGTGDSAIDGAAHIGLLGNEVAFDSNGVEPVLKGHPDYTPQTENIRQGDNVVSAPTKGAPVGHVPDEFDPAENVEPFDIDMQFEQNQTGLKGDTNADLKG